MAGNTFGTLFKIMTYGESHGAGLGVVIEGVPPNIALSDSDIQKDMDRRRPGQSDVTTARKEADRVEILSGLFEGKTTGSPISILIRNTDQKPKDYSNIKDAYRPGHADYTFDKKYGFRDYRGGGRSSGRETACRVAAGAVAKKVLEKIGVKIYGYTLAVAGIYAEDIRLDQIESNKVRCPDQNKAEAMIQAIHAARDAGDSVGGIVEVLVKGCPAGLGEPVFDKLDARLAAAVMSIGTIKGMEIGIGFDCAKMRGSQNNDPFTMENNKIRTVTNNAGGISGGISNGEDILLRAAVKPPSSIALPQETVDNSPQKQTIEVKGRHDPCLCPRVVPVMEAMVALTLVDFYLIQKSIAP